MQLGDKILKFTKNGKIELNVELKTTNLKGRLKIIGTLFDF